MQIIVVVGQICSGKTTYASKYPDKDYFKIEISDIVKKLTQTQERVRDVSLDDQIIVQLKNMLLDMPNDTNKIGVVITGIRQLSIYTQLAKYIIPFQWSLKTIVLEAPNEILKKRFNSRNDRRNNETFEEAVLKDSVLGLNNLIIYLDSCKETVILKNYNQSETLGLPI